MSFEDTQALQPPQAAQGPRRSYDLIAVLVLTLLTAFSITTLGDGNPLRWLIGTLFVFFAPGYCLMEVVLIRRQLDLANKVLISLALSMATEILLALVLHVSPLLITTQSLFAINALFVAGMTLGVLRRRHIFGGQAPRAEHHIIRPNAIAWQMFGLAFLIFLVATLMSVIGQGVQFNDPFTQLWLLPCQEQRCQTVTLGVYNYEYRPRSYRLYVSWGPGRDESAQLDLELGFRERWEKVIELPNPNNLGRRIEAYLVLPEAPESRYREVFLVPQGLRGLDNVTPGPASYNQGR
jgi:uncharacterized membrane protein